MVETMATPCLVRSLHCRTHRIRLRMNIPHRFPMASASRRRPSGLIAPLRRLTCLLGPAGTADSIAVRFLGGLLPASISATPGGAGGKYRAKGVPLLCRLCRRGCGIASRGTQPGYRATQPAGPDSCPAERTKASITSMFRRAFSSGTGASESLRMARANASPCNVY